jgi:hypothetical protein
MKHRNPLTFVGWGTYEMVSTLPSEPPTHLDKSCDPSIPPEYEKINTCLNEA